MNKAKTPSPFRWFNRVLLGSVVLLVVLANIMAFKGQREVVGDLTRIGNFRESQFQRSHVELIPTPAEYAARSQGYDAYSDIVIVGDSFSNRKESWADYLIEFTGMTTQIFHHNHLLPQTLVEFPAFAHEPPKLVIFQIIERSLKPLSETSSETCEEQPSVTHFPRVTVKDPAPQMKANPKPSDRYGDYNLSFARLRTDFLRLVDQTDNLVANLATLNRRGLFTNNNELEMLYVAKARQKSKWDKQAPHQILCFIESQRRIVESNGTTAFAVILVPDKLSSYQQWISDKRINNLSILPHDVFTTDDRMLNLHPIIVQSIDEGFADFYLPNDSHWSPKADRQVAKWVSRWLSGNP